MVESVDDREEILAAALCQFEEGIAVLDAGSRVLFWNPAAEAITGYLGAELLSRTLPADAYEIDPQHRAAQALCSQATPGTQDNGGPVERPLLVNLRHKQGHSLPAMLRRMPLRNALGKRFGTLLRFHPVEEIDTLPHGSVDEDDSRENRVESSQADMEERLDEAWQEWHSNAVPFGRDAADAMLGIVEHTLLHGLKPAEILGRWGTHEFLVLCHERTPEMLDAHAHRLGSLARTADFRWWGDRVSLSVSIGAAHAAEDESLRCLLLRAQRGMQESTYLGGNHVVGKAFKGGRECSQS